MKGGTKLYCDSLFSAIVLQALKDYEFLYFKGIDNGYEQWLAFSREEIEEFFNSEISDLYLTPIGLTGKQAFNIMLRKWRNGERYFTRKPYQKQVGKAFKSTYENA